ncbi:hypothetical protein [Streptomyces phaeoluteigriseus]|uniref:hypothetical protein n=1 Tax=Streptomyces phaeoluteigriseus TaxID=114686 RepID=UPI00117FB271|nr:hypothetical protein [Streptomyces phaeoluteigriseus]
MKFAVKGFAAAAAAISVGLFAASPASAATAESNWRTAPGGTWACNAAKTHAASDYISFKSCFIFNDSRTYVQSMLVVDNTSGNKVKIEGLVTTNFGGDVHCGLSDFNSGLRTVCLGPTKPVSSSGSMTSKLIMNGYVDYN